MSIETTKIMNLGDGKVLYDDLRGRLNDKADVIEGSIITPSNAVTFTDGADSIPMSVTAQINPVQNLNGYGYPWAAGCGKNLAHPVSAGNYASGQYGITATENADGSITLTGKSTATSNKTIGVMEDDKVLLPAGTYLLTGADEDDYTTYKIRIRAYDADNSSSLVAQSGEEASFTLADATNVCIQVYITSSAYDIQLPTEGLTFYPMIRLSTVTDDTYEPYSNICPITGWSAVNITKSGKNLIPEGTNTSKGYANKKILLYDGRLGTSSSDNVFCCEYFRVVPGQTYTYSCMIERNTNSVCFYDKDKNYIIGYNLANSTSIVVTAPDNAVYARANQNLAEGYWYQFEVGSTPTTISVNSYTTYAISIPSTPGTVYGGTLTVNKDGTGSLVVDRTSITLGSADQIRTSSTISTGRFVRYSAPESNIDRTIVCAIGEKLRGVAPDVVSSVVAWDVYTYGTPSHYLAVAVPADATTTTVDDAIKDSKVVYLLETPVTYPLTASQVNAIITSLYGINNVWADSGNILSVSYNKPDTSGLPFALSYGGKYLMPDNTGKISVDEITIVTESVSGTTPTITGVANHRYVCGEVSTISITPPDTGCIDVVFTSGTTAAVLTLPNDIVMPDWWEGTEANKVYEINFLNGYGVVTSWATN